MPGIGRRARLVADWTVGLFFGRSSSELGQLGHPPDLQGLLETPAQATVAPEPASD
jgi:NADH dehydrogenase